MLKMNTDSRAFLEKNLPEAIFAKTLNEALDLIGEMIDRQGFAPPHYYDYNDFGREAQRVYDDIYLSNQ